jgi:hypothetical protein
MAQLPLNTFRTITSVLTTASGTDIYTAPVGVTSIVLMAQISNISTQTVNISMIHHRNLPVQQNAQGKNAQPANVDSFLVDQFGLPSTDAVNVLSGKLILEALDSIRATASVDGSAQLVMSILESSNA